MAKRKILKTPNEVLRKRSKEVAEFSSRLHELLDDMRETLKSSNGVGIAAVQVGVLLRAVIVETAKGCIELINPIITEEKKPFRVGDEGCLSVPGTRGNVRRSQNITVTAQDRNGLPVTHVFTGRDAVCAQHELDHLDGVLFTDRLEK